MLGKPLFLTVLALAPGLAIACTETTESPAPPAAEPAEAGPATDAAPASPLAPPVFEPCSFQTGGKDGKAECANVEVPLDWAQPEGVKITIFVKRVRGKAAGPHKQLWLLQGGPGAAGDSLEELALDLTKENDPAFDIYIPDHRGTGRSAYLGCELAQVNAVYDLDACFAEATKPWGGLDALRSFTTTAAAHDLGSLIERTRASAAEEVHVYGISYGTYLVQRYLQLFPEQPTAVALDGLCQSGLCSFAKIGYWFDKVGKKYMTECAADAACSARLGPDPVAKVREAYAVAKAGTCAGTGLTEKGLRDLFGYAIASVELRALIPAVTHRLLRCDAEDVAALKKLKSTVASALGVTFGPTGRDLYSRILAYNIGFSEMEESPMVPREDMRRLMSGALFGDYDSSGRDFYDAWPLYPRDEHVGKYPSTTVPLLLLNGTLDPQTPMEFAEEIAPHYTGASQSFVLLPRAAHGTITQSPTRAAYPTAPCGRTVWDQFLADPKAKLDTSCRERVALAAFDATPDVAQAFFGTTSLYGDASLPTPSPSPLPLPAAPASPSSARIEALHKELRRAVHVTRPWVALRDAVDGVVVPR